MKAPLSYSDLSINVEPTALADRCDVGAIPGEDFSVNCLLRTVRVDASVCLLSRINYCFPATPAVSVAVAMRYADSLNRLLAQSKVYVVKDIDGDHGYFLRVDSVLQGEANRKQLSTFLTGVTKDIEALLKYFQTAAHKPQPESLSTIAEGCNMADLQTDVCRVA